MPPLTSFYDGPYTVLQRSLRHFKQRLSNKEENIYTSQLKPCTSESRIHHPYGGAAGTQPPPSAAACHCHTATLAPTPLPSAADSGTVIPGTSR